MFGSELGIKLFEMSWTLCPYQMVCQGVLVPVGLSSSLCEELQRSSDLELECQALSNTLHTDHKFLRYDLSVLETFLYWFEQVYKF